MYNPFKENRAEQMKDLWKYYVPVSKIIDESKKPLVLEGGRGSGKTMLFVCNSWREKAQQFINQKSNLELSFRDEPFIGIYYRVDSAFVSAICGTNRNDWSSIFETYLSIHLLKEFLDFIILFKDDLNIFNEVKVSNFINFISKKIYPPTNVRNFDDFIKETNFYFDSIEDIINGNTIKPDIRLIKLHRFIVDLCNSTNDLLNFTHVYKIFIDEYETLQEYQQKIINTSIKHSSSPVVFNIGLKFEGMKTNKTVAETETIEEPHDFERFSIDNESIDYINCLMQICQKRIQYGKVENKIPNNANENIDHYLGKYSIEDEIMSITNSKITPAYLNELRDIIRNECKKEQIPHDKMSEFIDILCDNATPINSIIHYFLLKRETVNRPRIDELYQGCIDNTQIYKEWIHNMKVGAIFLLAKSYKKHKLYFGFDVFSALSSGTIRYFLELCEQSFYNAYFNSDFNWDSKINIIDQSSAAKYVSKRKIDDIKDYVPNGNELKIFVHVLGTIFNYLHVSDRANLSEPEPNHFITDDLATSEEVRKIISAAIMWNVLQIRDPTKRKRPGYTNETIDYFLNKIYTPYFNISYRDQRKIEIPNDILKELLSGDIDTARKYQKKYLQGRFKDKRSQDDSQPSLFIEGLI
jgi:hypothetical protein